MMSKKCYVIILFFISIYLNMIASEAPAKLESASTIREDIRALLLNYVNNVMQPDQIITQLENIKKKEDDIISTPGYNPTLFAQYLINWFKSAKGWFGRTQEKTIDERFKNYLNTLSIEYQGALVTLKNADLIDYRELIKSYFPLILFDPLKQKEVLDTITKYPTLMHYVVPLLKKEFLLDIDTVSILLTKKAESLIQAYIENKIEENFSQKLNDTLFHISTVISKIVQEEPQEKAYNLMLLALSLKLIKKNRGEEVIFNSDEDSVLNDQTDLALDSFETLQKTIHLFEAGPSFVLLLTLNNQQLQSDLLDIFNTATQAEKNELIVYLKGFLGKNNVIPSLTSALQSFLFPQIPQPSLSLQSLIPRFNTLQMQLRQLNNIIGI